MHMNKSELWKNFRLGEELAVSGTFIYNGLRRFHELRKLDCSADLVEVCYQLSVGIERLMKIAIVLLEHNDVNEQDAFEKSLFTHNHQALIARIQKHVDLKFSNPENAFLNLLTRFYENLRYDRFSLNSPLALGKEKYELFDFLESQLHVKFEGRSSIFGHQNTEQYRKFIRNIVVNIASGLYGIIKEYARSLGLYTYELHSGSKAETVFLREANFPTEDILWKELLVFFMNSNEKSDYLSFLRDIPPLSFDPGLVEDYLDCFQSGSARTQVVDEMGSLYEELPDQGERLRLIGIIGSSGLSFPENDDQEVFQDESKCFDDPPSKQ